MSAGAGIQIHAKPGDQVAAGEPLLTLFTDVEGRFEAAMRSLEGAVVISEPDPVTGAAPVIDRLPLIIERIT